jgi:hypothetical protein
MRNLPVCKMRPEKICFSAKSIPPLGLWGLDLALPRVDALAISIDQPESSIT